jgi:hypothetical protein
MAMRTFSAAVLAMSLLGALGCGGVHTPDGETPAIQLPAAAGAGGGTQQRTASAGAASVSETDSGPPVMDLPASGGSSSAETDPSLYPPVVYCDAPAKLLTPKCGGGGSGSCHGNHDADMGDFGIDEQHAVKFVDKLSTRNAPCGRIIDSRDYSKSFMLLKVRGDLFANLSEAQAASADESYCGGRMPVGSIVISEDLIDCLASWLQQFQR